MAVIVDKTNFAVCPGSSWNDNTAKCFRMKEVTELLESIAGNDSGRSEEGVMVITEFVQTALRKWKIKLPPISPTDLKDLYTIVQGKKYMIKIFDIYNNSVQTLEVYTSTNNAGLYNGNVKMYRMYTGYNGSYLTSTENGCFTDVEFSAIELGTAQ